MKSNFIAKCFQDSCGSYIAIKNLQYNCDRKDQIKSFEKQVLDLQCECGSLQCVKCCGFIYHKPISCEKYQ